MATSDSRGLGIRGDEYTTIGRAAALLFAISILIGWLLGAVMLGAVDADERIIRGAHLSALLGPLFLAAYGWSLPQIRYGLRGRRWLTRGMIFTFYANPAFGLARGLLGLSALQLNGNALNDSLFVALNLFSALPTMVVSGSWIVGLWSSRAARGEAAAYGAAAASGAVSSTGRPSEVVGVQPESVA